MLTRNVVIGERRTTVRLEAAVWAALDELCAHENLSRHDVFTRLEGDRHGVNRAQAIRSAVVGYFRHAFRTGTAKPGTFEASLALVDEIVR